MFIINDTLHARRMDHFVHLPDAIKDLQRLARIPWNEEPNRAPCKQWQTCGPLYELFEVEFGSPHSKVIRSNAIIPLEREQPPDSRSSEMKKICSDNAKNLITEDSFSPTAIARLRWQAVPKE